MKKYAYGVDIGGTTVKIGFFETTGKLVDTWAVSYTHLDVYKRQSIHRSRES